MQADAGIGSILENNWLFPVAQCVHIISFALSIGMIVLVDFSLLSTGFPRKAAAQLLRSTGLWTLTGLVLIVFSGLLLFATDPDQYYLNRAFQIKMICLIAAIVFNYTVHRKVAFSGNSSSTAGKVVAISSLALWVAVIFSGLFIGFV